MLIKSEGEKVALHYQEKSCCVSAICAPHIKRNLLKLYGNLQDLAILERITTKQT